MAFAVAGAAFRLPIPQFGAGRRSVQSTAAQFPGNWAPDRDLGQRPLARDQRAEGWRSRLTIVAAVTRNLLGQSQRRSQRVLGHSVSRAAIPQRRTAPRPGGVLFGALGTERGSSESGGLDPALGNRSIHPRFPAVSAWRTTRSFGQGIPATTRLDLMIAILSWLVVSALISALVAAALR